MIAINAVSGKKQGKGRRQIYVILDGHVLIASYKLVRNSNYLSVTFFLRLLRSIKKYDISM